PENRTWKTHFLPIETIQKMDEDAAAAAAVDSDVLAASKMLIPVTKTPEDNKEVLGMHEDELISQETLRASPIQWPERFPGMEEFLTMSDTPIYTPTMDRSNNLTAEDIAHMNQLSQLEPDQLVEKIKSLQDEIYQLGLREAKEMTRGKLLGIFDRDQLPKRQP
ncbi:hypothetical protein KR059_008192, partial [Drosophila kikkawai]